MKNTTILLMVLTVSLSCSKVGKLSDNVGFCGGVSDMDCDGESPDCHFYQWDKHGNVVEITTDYGCEGEILIEEKCFNYVYDSDGKVLKMETGICGQEVEWGCGTVFSYGEDGGLVSFSGDPECYGSSFECVTIIERDSHGNITRQQHDPACDGASISENCTGYSYGSDGELTSSELDMDCDGSVDYCSRYIYDGEGRLVKQEADSACDGENDMCVEYKWECDNSL